MPLSDNNASNHSNEDHDQGLSHDLGMIEQLRIGRRRALFLLGSAGTTALLASCGGESGSSTSTTTIATPTPSPTPTPAPTARRPTALTRRMAPTRRLALPQMR
jgi:hypothetical protein